MAKTDNNFQPIKPGTMQPAEFKYRQFGVSVPGTLTKKQLEDPQLWGHVARDMSEADEVRVVADDMAFIARLICMYKSGSDVRMKLYEYVELDAIDRNAQVGTMGGFKIESRGPKGWCLVKIATGEIIREKIPGGQSAALRELEDYCKALAA